jgi:hypothetical protein
LILNNYVELGDIIVTIGRILNNLEKIQEEKGVPNTQQNLIDNNINNSSLGKKREDSSLSGSDKKKTKEVFSLFNESFFAYQKKQKEDTTQQTLISKLERQNKPKETAVSPDKKKGFNLLDFLLPLVGGVALIGAAIPTLIASLFEKVGFAGDAMKVLGKVGLIGGLKLLGKTFLKRFALGALKKIPYVGGLISLFFAYKEFKAGRIIPGLLEIVSGLANFVPFVGPILSIGVDVLKAFLESQGTFAEGGALSNANALGTIKGWASNMGKWIWDNALYIPIVGSLKRFGMAWDAFGSGNWSEGLKQTVYGLISIVPGGGFLIKGYEWLSSFLSASKEEQQAQINEGGVMGTIKGWISQIGTYISDNAMSLPIVGGIKRFGMAWDAFTSGNIGEGFKLLGEGVLAFVGGGPLVNGFNMLAGWLLGGETEDEKSLSPDGSWKDRLKNWIKGKLHKLPAFLRKPLEWFGILDETGAETGDNATVSAPKPTSKNKNGNIPEEESKGFFSKMADSIGSGLESLGSLASDMFSSLKTLGKNAFDAAFKKFSEILPELEKFTSDIFDKFSNQISLILPKIESALIVGVDNLYNMLSSAFDKISPKISEALQGVGSIIVDVFNAAKPTISESLKGIGSIIVDVFNAAKPTISESLKGIGSIIVDVFNAAKPIVSDSFSSYLESLKDIFSGIIPDIKSVMLNAFVKLSEDIINLAGEIPNNKYETLTNNEKGLNSKNDQTEFKNNEAISVAQIIEHASLNQCKYLEALVNIGNLTLKEMKRMNGSSGSASVIPQPIPMMSDGGKNRISLSDNRMGYAGSVYALG